MNALSQITASESTALKAKHTPGPWKTDASVADQCVIGPRGFLVADCAIFSTRRGAPTSEECTANRRMIAAAPDMLAALKQVRARCQGLRLGLDEELALDRVEAAIARAESVSQ